MQQLKFFWEPAINPKDFPLTLLILFKNLRGYTIILRKDTKIFRQNIKILRESTITFREWSIILMNIPKTLRESTITPGTLPMTVSAFPERGNVSK
ncbi:hypothetical protein [Methylobacter sp. S3L5C]|uniref:hypothetical protein n=1 Tax=Methylobacter sp. S3L5C TaxID=2839024 RepID=UPI001FAD6A12|nr:hypothetical protein [Methylobacter sp. S3L5C]UOA09152.1 hypothetical protein KKZ03_02190 [Methylobacter sp. S3L5C]